MIWISQWDSHRRSACKSQQASFFLQGSDICGEGGDKCFLWSPWVWFLQGCGPLYCRNMTCSRWNSHCCNSQSYGAAAGHPRAAYYSVLYGQTIGPLSYFVPHQTILQVKPIIFNKWSRELTFVNPTAVFVVNEGYHGTVFTICLILKPPGCCMM